MNVNSLKNKTTCVQHYLTTSNTDILCISETKLLSTDLERDLHIPGFESIRKDRGKNRGGGIAVYYKSRLNVKLAHPTIHLKSCEYLEIDIAISRRKKAKMVVIYRPPNSNLPNFLESLDHNLQTLITKHPTTPIIVTGDMNIDLHENTQSTVKTEYLNLLHSHGLKQTIDKATRITPSKCTLLDHMIVNHHIVDYFSEVHDLGFTDHQAIILSWRTKYEYAKQAHQHITFRSFKKYDSGKFKADLQSKNWSDCLILDDPDEIWSKLKQSLIELWNIHAPMKTIRIKQNTSNKPWINNEILKLIKKRNELSLKAKTTRDAEDWKRYKQARNKVNNIMSRAKFWYYRDKFEKCDKPSDLWKPVKNLLNKMKVKQQEIPDPETLATFFSESPVEVQMNIPDSQNVFWEYMGPRSQVDFDLKPVQEVDIKKIIKILGSKKAPGEDGIDNRLIKDGGDTIISLLRHLFNMCILKCRIPTDWKTAKVSAIHKKGDRMDPKNYRPISLLSTASKLFEKLIAGQLTTFLERSNLLAKEQHGFRRHRSTLTSLLMLTDKIYQNIDSGKPTVAVFLDLSKAFDIVDTNILIHKLEHYGIRGTSLQLFRSYLTSRNIFVAGNGMVSNRKEVKIGVPQGSILGPLLYIIYTNDFINSLSSSQAYIYADDTAITVSDNDATRALETMQEELSSASSWFAANKLKLNAAKTQLCLFGTPQQLRCFREATTTQVVINDAVIRESKFVNYLGVTLDNNMTFDDHIKSLSGKLTRTLGILSNIKHLMPMNIRKQVYNGLILSNLDYCSTIWGHTSKKNIRRLEKILNRTCRNVLDIRDRKYSATEMYKALKWLPLKEKLEYNKAVDCYKIVTKMYHTPLDFIRSDTLHHHNLRQQTLYVEQPNTTMGKRKLAYMIPHLWNSFSEQLKQTRCASIFKALYTS